MIRLILIGLLGFAISLNGEIYIECPCCQASIEIETEAKEIPGAGWVCDGCGMFQCHGTRCVYCGRKR